MNFVKSVTVLLLSVVAIAESQYHNEKNFPVLPTECKVASYDNSACNYDNLLPHPRDLSKYLQCGSGTYFMELLKNIQLLFK
jgi:hypothetical protein